MTNSKKINQILKNNSDSDIFHRLVDIKGITCKIADKLVYHYQWREYSEMNTIIYKVKETNPTLLNK